MGPIQLLLWSVLLFGLARVCCPCCSAIMTALHAMLRA